MVCLMTNSESADVHLTSSLSRAPGTALDSLTQHGVPERRGVARSLDPMPRQLRRGTFDAHTRRDELLQGGYLTGVRFDEEHTHARRG